MPIDPRDATIVNLGAALFNALNLSQLVHLARVNTPQVSPDEGAYELDRIRLALDSLAINHPDLYNQAIG